MLCFSVGLFFNLFFFFLKQKTAYEMRISDWSSDVCSSDLGQPEFGAHENRPRGCPAPPCPDKEPGYPDTRRQERRCSKATDRTAHRNGSYRRPTRCSWTMSASSSRT